MFVRRQFLFLMFCVVPVLTNGQTRTITGKVTDDLDLTPIPDVKIQNRDTFLLATTDINGSFKIEIPNLTADLLLSFLGMEWTLIKVPADCNQLEIILQPDVLYHYNSHRKIDRLREREYNKIPGLHLNAFKKGVFTTMTPCYTREFKPDKPQLDKIRSELTVKRKEIRQSFKKLEIGDTFRIPNSGTYRYDGTDRTTLGVYSYVVDGEDFECIIQGIIIEKRNNYDLKYRVTNCDMCKLTSIVYEKREMTAGQVFTHNMKYFKVLTK